MRPFTRRLGRISASFEPVEASLIADLVDQVRLLLAGRRGDVPKDPLVELTGLTVGPTTPPADPAVARLLPDFHATDPDLASALRTLHEPDLIAIKDANAVALLDSLPRGGGTVRLDEATAQAWLGALNDVRLALGVRLEITDDDAEPPGLPSHGAANADDLDDDTHDDDDTDAEQVAAMYHTYRWLSAVQDSLVTALS